MLYRPFKEQVGPLDFLDEVVSLGKCHGSPRKFEAGPGGEGLRVEDRPVADAVLDLGFGEDDGVDVLVGVLVLSVSRLGEFGEVDVDAFLAVAGSADDRREEPDGRHVVASFLGGLALRALNGVFARFQPSGDDFDQRLLGRLAVLLHEHELAVRAAGEDGDGVAVPDNFALGLPAVRQLNVEKVNADDLPGVLALGVKSLFRQIVHVGHYTIDAGAGSLIKGVTNRPTIMDSRSLTTLNCKGLNRWLRPRTA